MNDYGNSLIAVMVVCQIASVLSPDSDHARRNIGLVCALVALLTVIAPARQIFDVYNDISDRVSAFFESGETKTYSDTEFGIHSLMQYISSRYDVSELEVIVTTDENDMTPLSLKVVIHDCPYARRAAIEEELREMLTLPVEVCG